MRIARALMASVPALAAGLALAAFAAPQVSCGCAPPRAETLAEATVIALEVLCVAPPDRDIATAHGFQFWGEFSEYEGDGGALEVRPGRPCTLTYLGGPAGAREVVRAIDLWADARHMERPAALRMDGGGRYGEGQVEWRIVRSPETDMQTVQIVYSPASI